MTVRRDMLAECKVTQQELYECLKMHVTLHIQRMWRGELRSPRRPRPAPPRLYSH